MNDWPEFEMRSQEGEVSRWTREVNRSELDALYAPGRRVEVDYVVQHFRPKSISGGSETKIVLEIRVGRAVPSGNKR